MRPDLGSFCRLDELGLQVVGQRLELGPAVLGCRIVETDEFDPPQATSDSITTLLPSVTSARVM